MECPECGFIHFEHVPRCRCGHKFTNMFLSRERLILGRLWLGDPQFTFIDRPVRIARIEKKESDDIEMSQ